jgi:indolepyruvate decarboxylase
VNVGEYLFGRVRDAGVEHVFGIPGDFVVPHFAAAEAAGFTIVPTAHEPGAGFAADAYARLRGLGMVLTTFGAGALNMVNAIAQAYAEKSPVLVVSGAPEVQGRRIDALFHHRVKSYESQLNVYREVTGAAVALNDAAIAAEAIDAVLDSIVTTKRPGYIEVPRDILHATVRPAPGGRLPRPPADPAAVQEAMAEATDRIRRSARPVVYAGVETERFGLRSSLIALVERLGAPVVTSIEGKCVFPEDHPNFVGIYMGQAGSQAAQELVEGSDCLLMLGAFLTDVNTGQYTANIDRSRVISASAEHLAIGHHIYPDITLADFLAHLLVEQDLGSHSFRPTAPRPPAPTVPDGPLRTAHIIEQLNELCASERYVVTCDVGDCLYASVDLRTDLFLGPGYYNSMGFGVPAGLAVPLARPDRRAIVLVGDGGFQMTGLELSTAQRLGQNPIIILFDNGGYAMMKTIAGQKPYFDLPAWDYPGLARALGGRGVRVETATELRAALAEAEQSNDAFLIDAVLDPNDVSPTWRRITEGIRARMGRS